MSQMDRNSFKEKTIDEKLQTNDSELQHVCTFDDDDNDEFFESIEYFGTPAESEYLADVDEVSAQTKTDSEATYKREETFRAEGYTGTLTSGKLDAMTTEQKEENQCIDIKCETEVVKEYVNNDKKMSECLAGACANIDSERDQKANNPIKICPNESSSSAVVSRESSSKDNNFTESSSHANNEGITRVEIQRYYLGSDESSTLLLTPFRQRAINKDEMRELPFEENADFGKNVGQSFKRSDSCTDTCPKHCDEIIKYICKTCDEVACQACITLDHKNCNSQEFIPSFIASPGFSFEVLESEMYQIQKSLTINKAKINSNIASCKNMKEGAMSDFRSQRAELNRMFDCFEKDFERRLWQIEKEDNDSMQSLKLKQDNLEVAFTKHVKDYHERKDAGHLADAFTKIKMSREEMREIGENLEQLQTENTIKRYGYRPSQHIKDFTNAVKELGTIEEVDSKLKRNIRGTTTIKVKVESDRNPCKITGLDFLSEYHLIAVDYGNSSIKVVDVTSCQVIVSRPISPEPFDVTVIHDGGDMKRTGELVLTIPKAHKIKFIQYLLPDSFEEKAEAPTNGQCRGICYSDRKLYQTFPEKGKIEITDMKGQLLKRISTDTIGRMFEPQLVFVDTERKTIYVSDKVNHSVFSLTLNGEVKAEYTDIDLVEPRGLCVNTAGAVFVCSFQAQTVHHLSDNCEEISKTSVVSKDHPTPFPFSIAYSDKHHVLYVGMFTKDCIKALKLV